MKIDYKKLPGSKIELQATIDQKEFADYWQSAHEEALAATHIKGFRPGAAPKELAETAVDKNKVFERAAESAVRNTLHETTEDRGWVIIDKPSIEVLEAAPLIPGKERALGLKYKATFVVFPEIKLPDYKKIARTALKDKKNTDATEDEIKKTMEWLRQSRAKEARVVRSASKGDLIDIDVESFSQNKPIPGGKLKNDRFIVGESRYLPGFDEKISGHKEGESFNFFLTAPSDYWNKDLQNKEVGFNIRINGVFERQIPDLNDELAKSLGPAFKNAADLESNIKDGIETEKSEKERERLRLKIIDEIAKASEIDPPESMIEQTVEQMSAEVRAMAPPERLAENADKLKKELLPRARERVLRSLVMHEITKRESLDPSKEEVEVEARRNNLDPEKNYDYSYTIVRNRKLFEFLEKQ